ncbi:succinoglycan biosynthesis protein ExoH [Rhizobium sp. RU35A]|uniref:acyltransferase family protein n=1 Tax=Rhizobium sp. RU35A TaxID=1907414 RepID=UPI0009550A21|nr:acyltransferase [Rhizobium sp. RU35A]SIQ11102.1 succinoglycan biosynthesis protein ExoH [Rhizobium sp. RU35A]
MTVDQNISSRINLMRMLLIAGIVFVHVPYDHDASPFLQNNDEFDWLRVFLGESLFRIGVPCLSALSGYLLFRKGLDGFDYRRTLRQKARTLLMPFLIWNLSVLLCVLFMQHFGVGIGYFPDLWAAKPADWADHALAAGDFPVNLPLYFLRDLMVCIVLSPLLAFLVRKAPAPVLGVLFAIAVIPQLTSGIVLKQSILFSFTLGIFLALQRVDLKMLDRHAPLGIGLVLLAALVLADPLLSNGPDYPLMLDILRNLLAILGALGFWLLSAPLVRTRLGQRLAASGSLSFWTFCAHYPLLMLMWMVWNRYISADYYPVFYIGAVLLTFAVMILSNRLVCAKAPALYEVLTGSRNRRSFPPHGAPKGAASGPGHSARLIHQQR